MLSKFKILNWVHTLDLVTDDVVLVCRNERNLKWTIHRKTLDAASADIFEAAMQHDDRTTTLRQAQANKIADYQQACFVVSDVEIDWQTAERQLKDAREARAALDTDRTTYLSSIGLPDISTADLTDWVRQHETACSARDDLFLAEEATNAIRSAAKNLRQALATFLGMQDSDDLGALFRLAEMKADERKLQQADLKTKSEAHGKETDALVKRQTARQTAKSNCDEAANLWRTTVTSALPVEQIPTDLRDVLSDFRGLREISGKLDGLIRQINGMNRDRDAFIACVASLASSVGAPADQPALDTFRAAREALTAAEKAAEIHKTLTDDIAEASKQHAAAISAIATQDIQIRKLAEAFESSIETSTPNDLRQAVTRGKQAIDLRAAITKLSVSMIAGLGVNNRAEAEAALAAKPIDAAKAELATVTHELPGVDQDVISAIERRANAQSVVGQVQGDADVAGRVARQRTIEMEMQDGTLRYLEDRFGQMLAERAIRRYRDTHRGGMLVATEAAFHTLTNGNYAALSTQADGASEVLLATRFTDGSAKQVSEMSKGTKFQLYLALRAAAYEQVAAGGTVLPFFCDDIFETFDEPRTTAACGLMRQIGQRGQAIYLTHHRHVVDIAQQLCGDGVKVHNLVA